jgi:hypothetical protein
VSETQESLSSILSSNPATDVKPAAEPAAAAPSAAKEPEAKPVETEKPSQVRDESGKFAKAPEEKPAAEVKPVEKPAKSPDGALAEMRRRLQAAEARVREFESRNPKENVPSVFDDEDKAISSRVEQAIAPLREKLFRQSVQLARREHGESFAEAEAAFAEAVERDPRLLEAWRAAEDPGEYIYTVGLQIKELADVGGDFVKYREKVTGDMKSQLAERDTRIAALEAENAALKKAQADLESIPSSLNGATSGPPPKASEADAESLRNIVRFGNS